MEKVSVGAEVDVRCTWRAGQLLCVLPSYERWWRSTPSLVQHFAFQETAHCIAEWQKAHRAATILVSGWFALT